MSDHADTISRWLGHDDVPNGEVVAAVRALLAERQQRGERP